jgi:predicted MPP superfamily phosphohydrolase
MAASRELTELLLSLFSPSELRRFVRWMPDGERMSRRLPEGSASAADLTDAVVQVWGEHGAIDDDLRARLIHERPRRAADIRAVFGTSSPRRTEPTTSDPPTTAAPTSPSSAAAAPTPSHPPTAAAPTPPSSASAASTPPRPAASSNTHGTPPTARPVRLLHLSDLHLRNATQYDASPLLRGVLQVAKQLVAADAAPDLIVLTGDLAYSAQRDQYELVRTWLDRLLQTVGLDARSVLVVPGNHDVDRERCKNVMVRSVETALRTGPDKVVAEVLADPDQLRPLHARYEQFLAFLTALGVAHPATPSWAYQTTVHGLRLHFAGLDTAWLHSGEGLQGRLVLGLRAVHAALADADEADLVIGLAHHPLSWLVEWDQRNVTPPLRTKLDLLLRGHLHSAEPSLTGGPGYELVELAAGCLYEASDYANSFQLIELDPDAHQGRVRPWVWSPQRFAWVPDLNLAGENGVWTFPLRRRPR